MNFTFIAKKKKKNNNKCEPTTAVEMSARIICASETNI
jgi:hypothetical protein